MRRFQVHNSVYLEIMDEYEKQYPIDLPPGMYDDIYYYDMNGGGTNDAAQYAAELASMDPQ